MSRRFPFSGISCAAVLLLAVCGAREAGAYDVWLEPDTLFSNAGQEVTVTLSSGERFHAQAQKPLRRADVAHFRLITSRRQPQDLLGNIKDGQTVAARFRADNNNALLAMERTPKRQEQDAERFSRFLTDEGATAALATRGQSGQADHPVRERYTRYLKALVQDHDASAAPAVLYRRRVGQRLEILLENNPAHLRAEQSLGVKVLFENRPLPGAKITAYHRERPDQDATRTLVVTTNAAGRAALPIDAPGVWMLRTVHVRPAPSAPGVPHAGSAPNTAQSPGTEEPDWESFWTDYVVGVHLVPAAVGPATPGRSNPRSDERPPSAATNRGQAGEL